MKSVILLFFSLIIISSIYITNNNVYSVSINEDEDLQHHISDKWNYMIVCSKLIKPATTFGLTVHMMMGEDKYSPTDLFSFYASVISDDNNVISSITKLLEWNSPQTVYLPIPLSLMSASYTLKVSGTNSINNQILFHETTELEFKQKFLAVTIQTTRPIYRAGQIGKFRILALQSNLIPFDNVLDVFILDPNGLIMKRWMSTYTNNGVSSLRFKLPKLAKDGIWKIKTKIQTQINEKNIIVDTYFQPFFEVIIILAPYVSNDDDNITAEIYGIFPSQKLVRGNATLHWSGRKYQNASKSEFSTIMTERIFIEENKCQIYLRMDEIKSAFNNKITNIEIRLDVNLTEFVSGIHSNGYSHTRIISNKIRLRFLTSSAVFTPGMPLNGQVVVSYEDGERVPESVLEESILTIKISNELNIAIPEIKVYGKLIQNLQNRLENNNYYSIIIKHKLNKYLEDGTVVYNFDIPEELSATSKLQIIATYERQDQTLIEETLEAVKIADSANGNYLKLWTTSKEYLTVENYAIFHVRTNFQLFQFYYIIFSKNVLLRSGMVSVSKETSWPITTTFSVPISVSMAPIFHIIVYCITNNGKLLTDAVTLPVDGFTKYQTTMEVNMGKDYRAEQVEAIASGGEGAFIGMQAMRSSIYKLQAGNELTHSMVTDSLVEFETNFRAIRRMNWISRDGTIERKSVYFVSNDYTYDSVSCFQKNHLILLTNLFSYSNIIIDNNDDFIEFDVSKIFNDDEYSYRIYRTSRNSFIYDTVDGDWGFREIKKNDHEGIEFEPMKTPSTSDDWYFSAFSIDMEHGFSILNSPVIFSSKRPLMVHVSGPTECVHGEQIGLRLIVHNNDVNQVLVTVTLLASPHYKFVHVESNGIVSSYGARLSSGDHQILLFMKPESQDQIEFPIAPVIDHGVTEVSFIVSTQTGRQQVIHTINVHGEGALINRHTSIMLDLKNRAFVFQYLDIVVEESPVVPYQIWRRYVYGSPSASITLSGNLIGASFVEMPLTSKLILGRHSKGAESVLFEFHSNIWTLHYMRLTNQLHWKTTSQILAECNTLYAEIIRYFNHDGSFSFWEPSVSVSNRPSIWLSAWAVRVFTYATFPEWEFQIWIDPIVFSKTLSWILKFQQNSGHFFELSDENIDKKTEQNLSLTAHILLALQGSVHLVDGKLKTDLTNSILKGRLYLEKHLTSCTHDPYLLAIITYALTLTNSVEKTLAFNLLQGIMKTNVDGFSYWSKEDIPINPVKYENQKIFIKPRLYHEGNSKAVEATSYALLVHLVRDGITTLTENIVQWLISVKMSNNGFISSMDTAIAYQALTEFAFRSRLLEMTDINISVETMSSNPKKHHIHIRNSSLAFSHTLNIEHVWGHLNIIAKGAGLAVAQLDVEYGVDYEPLKDEPSAEMFQLFINEFYSNYRNKSSITIQSCFRYTRNSSFTDAAVLDIQLPTGYYLVESDALNLVKARVHPALQDVHTMEGRSLWFFDYIPSDLMCFNHTVTRWYPVGNMTLYRAAVLYALNAREHFAQALIYSPSLYVLNICEVCGSYQCPYCPYYNYGNNLHAQSISLSYSIILLLIITKLR